MQVVCYLLFIGALVGICRSFLFEGFGNAPCTFGSWSKCSMNANGEMTRTRSPTSRSRSSCQPETSRCTVGTFLADTFIENLLQPVVIHQGTQSAKGDRSVVIHQAIGNENVFVVATNNVAHFPSVQSYNTPEEEYSPLPTRQRCTEIRDRRGNLIMGNCNTGVQRSDQSRRKRSVNVEQTKRDLLIMLDESGSVGQSNFEKLKRIGAAIVKLLCEDIRVHRDKTRVSVMSFDSINHFHIPLYRFFPHKDNLATFIKQISYDSTTQGRTCMNSALQYAMDTALSNSRGGRRGHNGVEQDIILITDGCANCETGVTASLRRTVRKLIDKKISVYVIGVGIGSNCEQHLKILAQGGRCFHFFYMKQWNQDLDDFVQALENPYQGRCISSWRRPDGTCRA